MYQTLENVGYMMLCTIGADDGVPYGVPIPYVVKSRVLRIHMTKEGQRLGNLKKNSRVCMTYVGQTLLCPEQYSTDSESVIVTGQAESVTDRKKKIKILRMLCEECGLPDGRTLLEKKIRGGIDRMEIMGIPVEAVSDKARWRKPESPIPEKV